MRPYYERDGITLYHCRAEELLAELPPQSVDLVLTDPPYLAGQLDCFRQLAEGASRVCKDGAFVYAYSGTAHLPEITSLMVPPLAWFWLFSVQHAHSTVLWGRRLWVKAKHILVLTNGKPKYSALRWVKTEFAGDREDKGSGHPWQQGIGFALSQIPLRTAEDDLVLDPFLGSGTTAVACYQLGRRFIGCDINEDYLRMAVKRLAQAPLPLAVPPQPAAQGRLWE